MRLLLIALAATALAGCAAASPVPGPDDTPGVSTPAAAAGSESSTVTALNPDDPGYWDEIICRREPVTGTRLSRARCHSRYDWARMRGAATETMRDIESIPRPEDSPEG
jgi:hypothetical protein